MIEKEEPRLYITKAPDRMDLSHDIQGNPIQDSINEENWLRIPA